MKNDMLYDVCIVGAGPIGLFLGYLLAKQGNKVKILDKNSSRSTTSKASSLNSHSLTLLHFAGCVEPFLNQGIEISNLQIFWNNHRLMKVNYNFLPNIYKYILSICQPEVEKILEKLFISVGGELIRQKTIVSMGYKDNIVTISDNCNEVTKSKYVVGCDGAKSTVRNLLNIDFLGDELGVEFYMFDCELKDCDIKTTVQYYIKDQTFFLLIPQPGGTYRIFFKSKKDVDNYYKFDIKQLQVLIDECGPGGLQINKIIWLSTSRFYNRIASNFSSKENHVFLCGDSAHLFSPVGGLGMNTGFQDAFNLSWRLNNLLNNKFNNIILNDYAIERRKIANEIINKTNLSTKLLLGLDRNINGPLSLWIPNLSNRFSIKNTHPMNFSGLNQTYPIKNSNIEVGSLVPYFLYNINNYPKSSYDFFNGIDFVILSKVELNSSFLKNINLRIFNVNSIVNINENLKNIFLKFDFLLFRPDGFLLDGFLSYENERFLKTFLSLGINCAKLEN
ncbi:FAD-dependent monooxygenase [Acinetobacter oleivorans]|uniref:FAD-dependent monooxygenase n=1 Tax=Acinetobacter oleivorans TaxID=1148157 RepID=UPI00177D03F5|nr:FAD-dependent monooxygenase [Acinetobacter oleivorans]